MQHVGFGAIIIMLFIGCGNKNSASDDAPEKGVSKKAGSKRTLIENKGSDTLVNVAQTWAEAYAAKNPNVAVVVNGGGSGTGISALINGTADIANASRKMKDNEIELAKKKGLSPVEYIVGHDALSVFVHADNPLREATVEQLGKIYKEGGEIDKWSQLGVKVPGCSSDEIIRISRQNSSGTYDYFKKIDPENKEEYKLGSRDMHGSKDVVTIVEKTPCAIGYSGLAYTTRQVNKLCVKKDESSPCVIPSVETADDGSYPIARPLMMYTARQPKGEIKAYLDWILGDAGQCLILKKGYAPVREVTCN